MNTLLNSFLDSVPFPFPNELLDPNESPNIMITSPTSALQSHFPPSLSSLSNPSLHSLHSLSPGSSPTAPDFPSHTHTPHNLSRQHSYHQIPEYSTAMHTNHHGHSHLVSTARFESAITTPLPPSPGPLDAYDDAQGRKRQRTGTSASDEQLGSKKGSRARSDSAPLGYNLNAGWPQTRPRSGSGLQSRVNTGRREELPVPNIGSLSRGHTLPMLSIPGAKPSQSSS